MVTILFLIAIIGISALTTWGVVAGIKKVKTLKPIKFNIPKIVLPKIKVPHFDFTRKPKTTSVTISNPTIDSRGDVFQEPYWNTTSKPTNNTSGLPIPKNAWVMMIGVVVLGFVFFYFMHTWKMRKK